MKTAYQYHSIEPDGHWTSEPFPAAERRHIVQGVIAGFLSGHPRWATDLKGNFIYGLDAKGKEIKEPPSVSKRHHAMKKKSPAQLQREIDEVIARSGSRSHASMKEPPLSRYARSPELAIHTLSRARKALAVLAGLRREGRLSSEEYQAARARVFERWPTLRH